MGGQVGADLVVAESLGVDAVAFEIEEGDSEDRIDLAVDGLVGVPEDKGDVEGGEIQLGREEGGGEHCEEIAVGHADAVGVVGLVVDDHGQLRGSGDLVPDAAVFLGEADHDAEMGPFGDGEGGSGQGVEHEGVGGGGVVFGVAEGDAFNLDVGGRVADGVAEGQLEPEDGLGEGAGGVDEGEGEVALAQRGVRVQQSFNRQVQEICGLEGIENAIDTGDDNFI